MGWVFRYLLRQKVKVLAFRGSTRSCIGVFGLAGASLVETDFRVGL